jgi:hypothetical protein
MSIYLFLYHIRKNYICLIIKTKVELKKGREHYNLTLLTRNKTKYALRSYDRADLKKKYQ